MFFAPSLIMMRIVAGVECTWASVSAEKKSKKLLRLAQRNPGRWGIHPMRRKGIVVVS
jgi:hypothetical protein